MKLKSKIVLGYVLISFMAAVVCLVWVREADYIDQEYNQVSEETIPVLLVLEDLKTGGMRFVSSTTEYLLIKAEQENSREHDPLPDNDHDTLDSVILEQEESELLEEGVKLASISLSKYRSMVEEKFEHELDYLARISRATEELFANGGRLITLKDQGGRGLVILEAKEDFESSEREFLFAIKEALIHERDELNTRKEDVKQSIDRAREGLAWAVLALFFIAISFGYAMARSFVRPIEILRKSTVGFSEDNQVHHVEVRANDEIGDLADSFNRMTTQITNSNKELLKLKEYSDCIIESMLDMLVVASPIGVIDRVNQPLCRFLGYTNTELLGQPIDTLIQNRGILSQLGAVNSAEGMTTETFLTTKSGDEVSVQAAISPVIIDNGESGGLVIVCRDISEQKKAASELLEAKKFLETVLNSMVEEISILNTDDLTIVSTNKAFRDSYKMSDQEVLGKHCYKVTHGLAEPCQEPNDYCPVEDVLKTGQAVTCEHIHSEALGQEEYYEIQVAPIQVKDQRITRVIHLARNITKRKLAERTMQTFTDQLEANNRELANTTADLQQAHQDLKESQSQILQQDKMASIGQLAAGVAHEINNPMGFIISNLTTLNKYIDRLEEFTNLQSNWIKQSADEIATDELPVARKKLKIDYLLEDIPDLIAESLDGAERVKKIVQDLKSFSHIDSPDFIPVNLNELLESTVNIVWNEIKYKAILNKDYGELPLVPCYAQQLTQVFMNIIINASHAIENKGEISIATRQDGDNALVSIADTGCGMSEELQKRIFEPFFTTKEVGSGTGLGMSIAYDIINKHNGEFDIESAEGQGTTFHIRIPLKQSESSVNT